MANLNESEKTINITLDPYEIRGFITGLQLAINIAHKYCGLDLENYISELEEKIDTFSHAKGYQEWLKGNIEEKPNE